MVTMIVPLCFGFLLWIDVSHGLSSLSTTTTTTTTRRLLQPPFPDGPCGGRLVRIPENLYRKHQFLLPERPMHVWLPPDYDDVNNDKSQLHPVLYCHDGQNAVSDASSWTGASWRLTGALTRLAERGALRTPTPLVVLLASAHGDVVPGVRRRHLEYAGDGPLADAHAAWVAHTVVPYMQHHFRATTDPAEQYVMGSSLGGQASVQLLVRYPHLFAGAACLSPYFAASTVRAVQTNAASLQSKRVYLDIGGDMGADKVPLFDLLDHLTPEHWWNPGYFWLDSQLQPGVESMQAALPRGTNVCYHKEPGGRHNERAWAQRIDRPLVHLFGKEQHASQLAP